LETTTMTGTLEMCGFAAARAQADRRPAGTTEAAAQPEVEIAGKAVARRWARRRAAAAGAVARRPALRSELLVSWLIVLALLVAIAAGSVVAAYHAGGRDPAVRPIMRGALGASAPAPMSRDDLREAGTRDDE
jgi:hypothetical protein